MVMKVELRNLQASGFTHTNRYNDTRLQSNIFEIITLMFDLNGHLLKVHIYCRRKYTDAKLIILA